MDRNEGALAKVRVGRIAAEADGFGFKRTYPASQPISIGASRAAMQRNLAWMEKKGLIREVTGQGRFRMWRIAA